MAEALEQMILPAVNRHLVDTGERAEQVISQLMVSMVREGQVAVDCEWGANAAHAVSYTHLTLPTILLV